MAWPDQDKQQNPPSWISGEDLLEEGAAGLLVAAGLVTRNAKNAKSEILMRASQGGYTELATLIPPRQEGQATQRSRVLLSLFCSAFDLYCLCFLSDFGTIWLHFG